MEDLSSLKTMSQETKASYSQSETKKELTN